MREWLTIIIVLLILGVLLDGWRRMRQSKRQSIRMNLKANKFDDKDLVDNYTSELPNGGARVVGHRNLENARELTRHLQKSYGKKKKVTRPRPTEPASLNLDEDVPMLMDSVDDDQRYREPSLQDDDDFEPEDILMTGGRQTSLERHSDRHFPREADFSRKPDYEPVQQQLLDDEEYEQDDFESGKYDARRFEDENGEHEAPAADDDFDEINYNPDGFDPADYDPDEFDADGFDEDDVDENAFEEDGFEPESESEPSAQSTKWAAAPEDEYEPEEVLVINVMSVGQERFYGPELLDVITACGMRYGDMQIFHRHESPDGDGPLLFSMVNMVVPGTFDLNTMDEFETPGVSLFMTLPMKVNSMEAFNVMADTAKAIASHLGGELKDEQRSVMTAQTLEHCRQRIRDFERKLLSRG